MTGHRTPRRRVRNRQAREAFNTAREHGLEQRHVDKLRNLQESGRPSAHVASARVQHEGTRWERRGPLPDDVREHLRAGVGAKVRALRQAAGWSQRELGERAGWSASVVGRIEGGQHRPTHKQLAAFGKALAGPRREVARLVADELVRLASPHVRGRRARGVPAIPADAAEQEARLNRLAARLHSDRLTERTNREQRKRGR